jgi:Ni,Fe-hydrogenase I large subunit
VVISPLILEPLNSVHSLATMSRTNELASFVRPYQTVMYSTPPIPPRDTGVPRGLVPDYYVNKYGTLERVSRTKTIGGCIHSFEECLAMVREDFKKQMREIFGV